MAPRKRPNLKQGIQVERITLAPGTTKRFDFPVPNLINCTIRIENSTQLSNSTVLKIYFENYDTHNVTYYTLTPDRYGVYIDNKPLDYIIFENLSPNLYIDVYFEYLLKEYFEPYEEAIQFITVIQTLPPPPSNQLFQGTNNRYTGTLSNATFLQSVPIGTPMAVRVINSISTSTTSVGIIEIPLAANLTYHADIAPASYAVYGQAQTGEIIVFNADSITNQLPASATQSNATVQDFIIDYAFDFHMQVNFSNTYTITTSGSTTYINYNGDVFLYYYDNTSLPLANANVSSITQSNTQYTLSPTSGTTNGNGQVPVTVSEVLNSTTTLPSNTITASTTIAGISRSASATITPSFDFNITSSDNGYTITTSGTTTYINDSGTFTLTTTTGLALPNQTVSITQSNSNYTLTAGNTTNTNGEVDFTITQPLNSTSNLSETLTASSTVATINKSINITPSSSNFDFAISLNEGINYLPLPAISNQFGNAANVTISSNTTLTQNLICENLTINSGVTLTTNGYAIICYQTFTNNGTIVGGLNQKDTNYPNSYGGSGGGGGWGYSGSGEGGYSTLAPGGGAGGRCCNCSGGNGTTPSMPTITTTLINNIYNNPTSYLSGASGGAGGPSAVCGSASGGYGSYGVYIQANNITAGTINTVGQQGAQGSGCNGWPGGGGGGGGGGTILLIYTNSYTSGTYNNGGGGGGGSGGCPSGTVSGVGGGGGAGLVLVQQMQSTITATVQTNQSTPEPIPNQTITFTISGSGSASFSPTSSVLTTTATTNSNGQVTINIYDANGTNTLTASCTIANITQTASTTI